MIELIRTGGLVILTGFLLLICRSATAEPDPFVVEFLKTKVAFSGTTDSKETADRIASEVLLARPDLDVVNTGLAFDPEVKLPNLKLMCHLIVEIALSTHEGVFEISDDSLTVGGLTDSVVTSSVLRLRAAPILGDRQFRQQVCLVPGKDLPEIPIMLSTGETRKAYSFDLELKQKKEVTFEPPGIILTKLLGLIEGTSNPDLFPPVISAPVVIEAPPPPEDLPEENPVAMPVLPERPPAPPPPSPYQEFGPVVFARNSVVLQSGQLEMLKGLAPTFDAEPWQGREIIVRALVYQSGSKVYARWVGERRMAEAVRFLKEAGVPEGRIKPEAVEVAGKIDRGEVKILILKPDGYVSPPPEEEEG